MTYMKNKVEDIILDKLRLVLFIESLEHLIEFGDLNKHRLFYCLKELLFLKESYLTRLDKDSSYYELIFKEEMKYIKRIRQRIKKEFKEFKGL